MGFDEILEKRFTKNVCLQKSASYGSLDVISLHFYALMTQFQMFQALPSMLSLNISSNLIISPI